MQLVALGWPDKQIAAELQISEETVSWHLRQMFATHGVHSRAALVSCHQTPSPSGGVITSGISYTNV
ncbi:MAG: helix-turn-helix transcriptional regulator [Verrucomicrobia bacterium]|nr:helix-turn-helix transcriptional regulator [Verrucomicrobiota bacterium]